MNNHTIAVYGTLRRGERANGMLDNAVFIGTDTITGSLFMATNNAWFPYMTLEGDTPVVVDIYTGVDEFLLQNLDGYEGYDSRSPEHSLYRRVNAVTNEKEIPVEIYVQSGAGRENPVKIVAGDWKKRASSLKGIKYD